MTVAGRATFKVFVVYPFHPVMNSAAIVAPQKARRVGLAGRNDKRLPLDHGKLRVADTASGAGKRRFSFTFPATGGAEIFHQKGISSAGMFWSSGDRLSSSSRAASTLAP